MYKSKKHKVRKNKMGVIEIWSILAVVLHFCGVGAFAEWPVIAGPFTWSCLCLEIWVFIVYFVILALVFLGAVFSKK